MYDVVGRRVATIFEGHVEAGEHSLVWFGKDRSGRHLPSGAYFLRLSTRAGVEVRKMAIVK